MEPGKKTTDDWYPVILLDADGVAVTGVAYGNVTCKYSAAAATSLTTYSVTTDDWKEAGEGNYWLRIGAGEWTAAGRYQVSVAATGAVTYNIPVDVTTNSREDVTVNYSATRGLAGTALPAAAADAAGGLAISDAGGLDLDAILAGIATLASRIPGAITISGGIVSSDMVKANGSAAAAATFAQAMGGAIIGTVETDAGNSGTTFKTDLTAAGYVDDAFNGGILTFVTGDLAGERKDITAWDYDTKFITVTALTRTPTAGDKFVIT